MRCFSRAAAGLGAGALLAVAALAVVGPLDTDRSALLASHVGRQQQLQSLAYTFTPEENPLADFDKVWTPILFTVLFRYRP